MAYVSSFENGAAVEAALNKGLASDIASREEHAALINADAFLVHSSASGTQKKTLWSNIKSVLKTYFDTLYATISHNHDSTYAAASHNHDSAYAPKITITTNTSATTISITTAADKTVYRYTQGITALAITNNPSTAPWAYRVEFTAGGNFTPSFPTGVAWNGGSSFALTSCVSGKKYSIIITSHISSFSES